MYVMRLSVTWMAMWSNNRLNFDSRLLSNSSSTYITALPQVVTKIIRFHIRFDRFRWPYGHAGKWFRLPALGYLLLLYSNHSPKMHRFELRAWDRQIDGQTSGRTDCGIA